MNGQPINSPIVCLIVGGIIFAAILLGVVVEHIYGVLGKRRKDVQTVLKLGENLSAKNKMTVNDFRMQRGILSAPTQDNDNSIFQAVQEAERDFS